MGYEKLKEELYTGHEFEFIYKGKSYSITKEVRGGRSFIEALKPDTEQLFANEDELLTNLKIDGKFIREMCMDMDFQPVKLLYTVTLKYLLELYYIYCNIKKKTRY